jgi:DNA segregation ATPase FtsK/SpoIIIE, S-DNA-T family
MAARTASGDERGGISDFLTRRAAEALGVGLLVLALVVAVALWGYDPNDPSLNHATAGPSSNPLGAFGASLADIAQQTLGLAPWLLVLVLPVWALRLIFNRPLEWPWLPVMALPLALLASSAWLASRPLPDSWPFWVGLGGFIGDDYMRHRLEPMFGPDLYPTLTGVVALVLVVLSIGLSWREVWHGIWALALAPRRLGRRQPATAGPGEPRWAQAIDQRYGDPPPVEQHGQRPLGTAFGQISGFVRRLLRRTGRPRERVPDPSRGDIKRTIDPAIAAKENARRRRPAGQAEEPVTVLDEPPLKPARTVPSAAPAAANGAAEPAELVPDHKFKLPPLSFLTTHRQRGGAKLDRTTLADTARALEKVLDDFGVRGEIVDVRPGPVVTLYELEPAPGTRAARVVALADDIARSLCAMSVRVATVPGRNVIGIELPNDQRETVYLRDLLASPAYEDTSAGLSLALGKDIGGDPVVVDLARMPHLLIAGTTGSGKSVAINAMILSLLYRLSPDQCRIIMIDPKVIELSVYERIPHLLTPVVTEPHKAVVALKWVVRAMDDRYRLMSHLGVRDIFAYNRRIGDALERGETLSRRVQTGFEPGTGVPVFEQQPIEMTRMPLIVVVVDEVADLMLTAGKEIEAAIQRLSQKARAAGIHLIVATQRPSVDVLTGVIKANLPSRISFRVSSKIDSRTILGEPGAEQLLGQGDMLHMMPGERITRIHGPLVTDEEVERVVGFLRQQGEPDYLDSITDEAALDTTDAAGPGLGEPAANGEDAQYAQALQIVASEGKASTSFLQRKMRIGYNSAARLIERMESDGHVSHPDHVGRRQVLIGGQDAEADSAPW